MPWALHPQQGPGPPASPRQRRASGRIRGTPVAGSAAPGMPVYGTASPESERLRNPSPVAMSSGPGAVGPAVTELRVHNFSISLDGAAAGPAQSVDDPMGVGGERLHEWMFVTGPSRTPVDDDFRARGTEGIGATIMGRNMFGPVRGRGDSADEWRGWGGEDPPFHHDVFVLTHD